MTLFRTSFAALLIAVPLWLALTTPAYACSCVPSSREDRVNNADAIAVGRTTVVQPVDASSDSITTVQVSFDVEQYVKGSGPTIVTFTAHAFESNGNFVPVTSACSWFPAIGELGLAFLSSAGAGAFETSTCAGSFSASEASEAEIRSAVLEIQQILAGVGADNLSPPNTGVVSTTRAEPPAWPIVAASAAFACTLLLAPLAVRRLRNRS
jgi:hypothetical protein